jgi:hypothetical protein
MKYEQEGTLDAGSKITSAQEMKTGLTSRKMESGHHAGGRNQRPRMKMETEAPKSRTGAKLMVATKPKPTAMDLSRKRNQDRPTGEKTRQQRLLTRRDL